MCISIEFFLNIIQGTALMADFQAQWSCDWEFKEGSQLQVSHLYSSK